MPSFDFGPPVSREVFYRVQAERRYAVKAKEKDVKALSVKVLSEKAKPESQDYLVMDGKRYPILAKNLFRGEITVSSCPVDDADFEVQP